MKPLFNKSYFLHLLTSILLSSLPICGEESSCGNEKTTEKSNEEKKEEPKNKGDQEIEPPPIGNFALPSSQQPSGLFAFGGNVIDKGEVQLFFFADEFVGKKRLVTDLIPGIVFGITNEWSIFFTAPFTPILREDKHRSSGLQDFFVQLEYAFYNKKTADYVDQATIVANVTLPTGSLRRNPPTGFGAPTLFLGATYYHTMVDWTLFTAQGAILTTSDHGTKIGDQFLYQFGVSKNIPSPQGWIYAWMVEVDGQYGRRNRIDKHIDPNSGGNILLITPSLWISSENLLLQFGVSAPINQNFFGKQHKFDYVLNFNFAWSFY